MRYKFSCIAWVILSTSIYSMPINTIKVPITEITVEYDHDGYPTTETLKKELIRQFFTHHDADKISIHQIFGGNYSERLWVAKYQNNTTQEPVFYLKISLNHNSTQKLLDIKEGTIYQNIQNGSDPNGNHAILIVDNFPTIIWIEHVFSYKDQYGATKTIEITKAVNQYSSKEILHTEDQTAIEEYSFAVGKSLAALHLVAMDYQNTDDANAWISICQGDFNIKNIFFNPTHKKIYIIDNEDMHRGCIKKDLQEILANFTILRYIQENYKTRWPLYLTYCTSFLQGYIESFPPQKRSSIALLILFIFNSRIDDVVHQKRYSAFGMDDTTFNEKEFTAIVYEYLYSFMTDET